MNGKAKRTYGFPLAVLLIALSATNALAQNMEEAFRNKTVRILIPTGPGGDRALYTLPFASFYGRHIPGNPTVTPVFMPGAGGSLAINNIYSVAAPDGLTITTPLGSVLNAQVTGDKSVTYDARKLKWIGRTDDATRVLVVSSKVAARSFDDLKREEVVVGAVGQASETYSNPAFLNQIFGTKFKIINGYGASGKIMLAMISGETQGAFSTWNNVRSLHRELLRDGQIRVLLQIALSKHPALPEVPLLLDLAQNDADRQLIGLMSSATLMGQSFAAPPGVSPAILQALRRAFDATMKDPDFVEKMQTLGIQFNPMTGEDLTLLVDRIMSTSETVIERYKATGKGE